MEKDGFFLHKEHDVVNEGLSSRVDRRAAEQVEADVRAAASSRGSGRIRKAIDYRLGGPRGGLVDECGVKLLLEEIANGRVDRGKAREFAKSSGARRISGSFYKDAIRDRLTCAPYGCHLLLAICLSPFSLSLSSLFAYDG